jgi:hypothetical protein
MMPRSHQTLPINKKINYRLICLGKSGINKRTIAILNELWKNREEEIKEKTWKN